MMMGTRGISYALTLIVLLQGVAQSWALVKCYQCSYYTAEDKKVEPNCKVVDHCAECQTRLFKSETHEIISRDCVSRCVAGGVPVNFQNIKSEQATESCCSKDLCNVHPSGASRQSQAWLFASLFTLLVLWLLRL